MDIREHTTEKKKDKIKLPWLNNKFVDNNTDLLTYLASVPPEKRQGVATSRDLPQPNERASENVTTVKLVAPRLFALVIGIDDYMKDTKLRGSCADALAIAEYLKTGLNVPSNQITVLLDECASRKAILDAFKRLKDNEEIQPGDPILIFYAGHGAEIFDNDVEGMQKIQSIIPQDHDGGIAVHPIPDKTIGSLLAQLHREKGDNIIVILDCCHSGGMCRDNDNGQSLVRAAEIDDSYRLPDDLDADVTELTRTIQPAKTFAPGALNTHVLLAACSERELARESGGRGKFTKALLELFKVARLEQLSYYETLALMEKIDGQNPQCEGNNRKRRFFDGKAPSQVSRLYKIHKDEKKQKYKLNVGSIHGLSDGAKFDIYIGSDSTSILETLPVCKTIATHVTGFELTLAPISRDERFPEDLNDAWAVLKAAGRISEPKLFMALDDRLLPVFDALVHLRTTSSPHQVNFALAEDRAGANLEVEIDNGGKLGFIILDQEITKHGLRHLACKVDANFDSAIRVLRAAAHYFHQLHLSQQNQDVEERIDIQFLQVEQLANTFSYRTATGPNLIKDRKVSLEIDDGLGGDEPVYYGVKITNNTSFDLYPHVFSLDSSGFAIKSYYGKGIQAAGVYSVDAPLRATQTLTIGYGNGGANAFDFYIPKGQDVDVSFLKFIFSTRSVDLEDVECESPFLGDNRGMREAPPLLHVDGWGSTMIAIAQKRKSRQM